MRLADARRKRLNHIGVVAVIVGATVTMLGLFAGFFFLFSDEDDTAKALLSIVPIGFLVGFTGVVTTLFSGSSSDAR